MQQDNHERHLEFVVDGNLIGFSFGCPFALPTVRPFQAVVLIGILYEEALQLENVLKAAGRKMNHDAIMAFRVEIDRAYFDIMNFKAAVEN